MSRSLTRFARWLSAAVVVGLMLLARPAHAADPERVQWSPDWPRFRATEAVFTAGMALQAGAAVFVYPDPQQNWQGGILFDDAARDALRLHSPSGRRRAARWSDTLYYTLAAYPIVVDAGVVAAGLHGSGDVATQLLAIDLEAYALSGAIALSAEKIGRVRPAARGCSTDANYSEKCGHDADLNASFLSGHTTIAFTSAGLVCAHHQHLPLYGGGAADLGACLGALTAASTAGVLRVMSDNHYSSDVLLGAGVGLFGGYVLPALLHYGFGSGRPRRGTALLPSFSDEKSGLNAVLAPAIDGQRAGLLLAGGF